MSNVDVRRVLCKQIEQLIIKTLSLLNEVKVHFAFESKSKRIQIDSNQIDIDLVLCRFGTEVAKTESEPNRTESFRGVSVISILIWFFRTLKSHSNRINRSGFFRFEIEEILYIECFYIKNVFINKAFLF